MPTVTFTLSDVNGQLVSSPEEQTVTAKNTSILFQLDAGAAAVYALTGYTSNDTENQLGPAFINSGATAMSVNDVNTEQEDINITVQSTHRKTGAVYHTDPMVKNRPPN